MSQSRLWRIRDPSKGKENEDERVPSKESMVASRYISQIKGTACDNVPSDFFQYSLLLKN